MSVKFVKSSGQIIAGAIDAVCNVVWHKHWSPTSTHLVAARHHISFLVCRVCAIAMQLGDEIT